ncbi:phage portal protein [Clostridium tertium]|uniref:phage portal protein n=1 Tax=Clostridium tertium TaxID=1559 RepID=UPI001FD8498B|nr:phage portal protein [Clostridium tertium]MBP1869336.1 HK97 family phage portal protein [Clostridium tertium]
MNVFSRIAKGIKNAITPAKSVDMQSQELLEWLGISSTPKKLVSEVTYFTCLKMLSETLGKMPLKFRQDTDKGVQRVKSNKVHRLLRTRPNALMTPSIFWATVEQNRNHYGNAYVWIRRKFKREKYGGSYEIQDLWVMPSNDVQVLIDDEGYFGAKGRIWYLYTDKYSTEQYLFNSDDVMHFKTSYSFDGILGVPVREVLKSTLEGGLESQNFMNNLYKSGLTAKAVLEYTGDLDKAAEEKLVGGFERFANGSENSGKIIPVPLGMKLVPLDIKLTDSQFFELKKFNALQIAGAFGIKPNQLNDYEKSSYSNSEMQQLSFYVDTVLFILKQYEEELNYKLLTKEEIEEGYHFKFNEKVLLRTDSKTQMEILSKGVNNGLIMPNEGRDELGYPSEEGGDVLVMNGNYIPITDVGKQYKKGGEANEKNT